MKTAIVGWIGAAAVLFAGVASAEEQKQDNVDWPVQSLFTDDVAQVQNEGEVQTQASVKLRRSGGDDQWEAPLEAQVGVLPRLQLDAQVPWMSEQQAGVTSRGVGNVELGTDYRLLSSSETNAALSVGLGVEIPTGSSEVEENGWVFRPRLRGFKQVGIVGLNASLAPALARDRDSGGYEPEAELTAGVTLGNGSVIPMLEGRGELGGERAAEGILGLRVKAGEKVELGAGVLGGVRDGEAVYGGTSNLSIELGG